MPTGSRTCCVAVKKATKLPWAPATDGIRNITGTVDSHGKATIYGITSTVSGNGDQGADPNRLVAVTDDLTNTDKAKAAQEKFTIIRKANFAEVLRGVAFAPVEQDDNDRDDHSDKDNHSDRD